MRRSGTPCCRCAATKAPARPDIPGGFPHGCKGLGRFPSGPVEHWPTNGQGTCRPTPSSLWQRRGDEATASVCVTNGRVDLARIRSPAPPQYRPPAILNRAHAPPTGGQIPRPPDLRHAPNCAVVAPRSIVPFAWYLSVQMAHPMRSAEAANPPSQGNELVRTVTTACVIETRPNA